MLSRHSNDIGQAIDELTRRQEARDTEVSIHLFVYVYRDIYAYICTCTEVYIHMYVYMYAPPGGARYRGINAYICVYVCMYIRIRVYIAS